MIISLFILQTMNTLIVASALFISIVWAGITVVTQLALKKIHIMTWFTITVIATFVVACTTIPFYSSIILQDIKIHPRTIIISLVAMLLTLVVGQFLYYYVLKHTPHRSYTTALLYTTPLFVLLIGLVVLKDEKVSYAGVLGVVLIFFGSVIMSVNIKNQ